MSQPTKRLWGIDVIAALYAVATALMIWLANNGTPLGRTFGLWMAPVCGFFCLGVFFRINFVRVILLVLLTIALVGDIVLLICFLAAYLEFFKLPINKDPMLELLKTVLRLCLTFEILSYLKRPDVRSVFRKEQIKPHGEPISFAFMENMSDQKDIT
jgi:hypothetical protein